MQCSKPAHIGEGHTHMTIRCRKCMPCRITRREEWTARIILENLSHTHSIFVTLTYSDENLPELDKYPGGNLRKKDLQGFLKRLRSLVQYQDEKRNENPRAVQYRKIRHFACGEYGEKSGRAHYHLIIFGLSLDDTPLVEQCWTAGFTHVREFTKERARYTAQYTTKKITGDQAEDHYGGRQPEFSMSSKRPGLGDEAAELIAETLMHGDRREFIYENTIRVKGGKLRLDEFMKRRITHYLHELGSDTDLKTMKYQEFDKDEKIKARKASQIRSEQQARKIRRKEQI